jgi:hypothetical protein
LKVPITERIIDALSRATNIPYSSSRVVHWFEDDDMEGLFALGFVHSQHHKVYKAICDGEGYRAEMTMRAHIGFTVDHIRSKYFNENKTERSDPVVAIEYFRYKATPLADPTRKIPFQNTWPCHREYAREGLASGD